MSGHRLCHSFGELRRLTPRCWMTAIAKPVYRSNVTRDGRLRLERVPMRSNYLSTVMPVPGLDPGIVAGIHVFLAELSKHGVDGRDEPGHDSGEMVQHERNAL